MHLLFVNCDCHYDSTRDSRQPRLELTDCSSRRRWDRTDLLTDLLIRPRQWGHLGTSRLVHRGRGGIYISDPETMGTSRGMSSRQTHNALDTIMFVGWVNRIEESNIASSPPWHRLSKILALASESCILMLRLR